MSVLETTRSLSAWILLTSILDSFRDRINDENVAVCVHPTEGAVAAPSLMRESKPAALVLQNMLREVNCARTFLREISGGKAGSDGPYFSPCHAKNAKGSPAFHSHPFYIELSKDTTDYDAILNEKFVVKDPAKRTAQQQALILKLRQVRHLHN